MKSARGRRALSSELPTSHRWPFTKTDLQMFPEATWTLQFIELYRDSGTLFWCASEARGCWNNGDSPGHFMYSSLHTMTHPWQSVGVIVEGACRERNGKHANLPKFSVRIELLPHFPHLALRRETVGVASWHHQPMRHHMGDGGDSCPRYKQHQL